LLALPEFILTAASLDDHDELVADVELSRDVQPCTRCGVIELHPIHDWRTHTVRHLPVAGRATRVVWRTRLLVCIEGCGTFVERTASIAPGAVWSRAAARAAVALSEANVAIETIRRQFGVGWNTVMRAVIAAAEQVTAVSPTRSGHHENQILQLRHRSLTHFSGEDPRWVPIDGTSPEWSARWVKAQEVDWTPWSEWIRVLSTRGPAPPRHRRAAPCSTQSGGAQEVAYGASGGHAARCRSLTPQLVRGCSPRSRATTPTSVSPSFEEGVGQDELEQAKPRLTPPPRHGWVWTRVQLGASDGPHFEHRAVRVLTKHPRPGSPTTERKTRHSLASA
jgi:hypothetical protein